MEPVHSRHTYNEITIFLVNLFFLEVGGKFLLSVVLLLLRLFGMERIAAGYYALPRHSFYTFFILLCVATFISIFRVVKGMHK
jgi:hypothetical protein